MTESLTMATLYGKLSEIGLKKNYVRKNGLPSWWDDELNDKPVAVLEGAGLQGSIAGKTELVWYKNQKQLFRSRTIPAAAPVIADALGRYPRSFVDSSDGRRFLIPLVYVDFL